MKKIIVFSLIELIGFLILYFYGFEEFESELIKIIASLLFPIFCIVVILKISKRIE
jgi:hypothetical protein